MKDIPVLFENDFCMTFCKPPGLPTQGGAGIKVSLDSILSRTFSPRPLLVHRLDRDTSGIILAAKTKAAAAEFSVLFSGARARRGEKPVKKIYLCVCAGKPEPASGVISLALDVHGKEKKSETFYKSISAGNAPGGESGDIPFSLLEVEPGTGRMHQIRRHLAKIGHPLLGDDKYGDFSLNKKLRKTAGLKNLLLHAARLVISPSDFLPGGLDIEAPLPDYFSAFLENASSRQNPS